MSRHPATNFACRCPECQCRCRTPHRSGICYSCRGTGFGGLVDPPQPAHWRDPRTSYPRDLRPKEDEWDEKEVGL